MKPALLICINSLRSGGAERVVSQLLNHMQHDFELHLALYTPIIEYRIPQDIRILDLQQSESDSQVSMLVKLPSLSKKVNEYCRKNKILYSISFLNRPNYINALMRAIWGYKGRVVMCERTFQTAMLQTKSPITRLITRSLIRASYNQADLLLANAEAMKADLQQNYAVKKPIQVIYNPIDTVALQASMQQSVSFNFNPALFYFIAVGNFRKEKNFPLLIEAFSKISDNRCRLLIVGDGLEESLIRKNVLEYGLTETVEFLGRDSNPFKYVHRSQAFVMCSDVEGFPNVLLEALACGRAVIATDCSSGPRELLAPGTDPLKLVEHNYEIAEYGILTPVGNAIRLADSMQRVLDDHLLRQELEKKAPIRAASFDISHIKKAFVRAFVGEHADIK